MKFDEAKKKKYLLDILKGSGHFRYNHKNEDYSMKKILLLASFCSLSLFNIAHAKDQKKVVIDRTTLKIESKAGKAFEKEREQKYKELREFHNKKQQEVAQLEQTISAEYHQGKISQEEAQMKIAKIGQAQRRAGLEIEEKKEEITAYIQELERKLDTEIVALVPEIATKNGWTEVRDTQGNLLYAATELDKTQTILEAYNKTFESKTAKAQLVAKTTPASTTTKKA
jgi:Skp family chaperone for outer membrane proteins